jgi:hypothetical protein
MASGCGNVRYNAVGDVRYLLFTNLHVNAHPLRNKFVIYGAEAVLIDFNGNCGITEDWMHCTYQMWLVCQLCTSAQLRILE